MRKLFVTVFLFSFIVLHGQRSAEIIKGENFDLKLNESQHTFKDEDLFLLIPGNLDNATAYYMFKTESDGFVIGTNEYNDLAKAQVFKEDMSYEIFGAFFWIGQVDGDDGDVHFNVWDFDGSPGEVLGSETVSVNDINATTEFESVEELFYVEFNQPVLAKSDFMIGFDMSDIGSSDIGMVHTDDGDGGYLDLAMEQWDDGSWNSIMEAWQLDIDIIIFPLVGYAPRNAVLNVDMTEAIAEGDIAFDPEIHDVYVSGTFNDWIEPGEDDNFMLEKSDVKNDKNDEKDIYTISIEEIEAGQHFYRYFLVEDTPSSDMSEKFDVEKDRHLILFSDIIRNDVFGVYPPIVEPAMAKFDLNKREDIETILHWGQASEVEEIKLFDEIINEELYTVTDNNEQTDTLSIKQQVFADAKWDDHFLFKILFDNDDYAMLLVYIAEEDETGISGVDNDTQLNIYPNPARDIINIEFDRIIKQYVVYDITGKRIDQSYINSNAAEVNVSGYDKGIYIIRIFADDGVYNRKIQVTR